MIEKNMPGRRDVLELFENKDIVKVCAPMVRYSKLEFRSLVRKYGCDLCFTPMIMADSFISSEKARQNEFKTNLEDSPLVVQFAANSVSDFVRASEMVSPFCDGVDLNCGCPQRWAMKDGYGADLLAHPHLIRDMVLQVRNAIPRPFSVSVKLRIKDDIRTTVQLAQNLEAAGASFISLHGRTPKQRSEPVNMEAIKNVVDGVQLPVIANGDIRSLEDVENVHQITGCRGAMSARGILQNPAMFNGASITPIECVQDWMNICLQSQTPFQCYHHHLVFMLEKVLPKSKRRLFNSLNNSQHVTNFLVNELNLEPPSFTSKGQVQAQIMYKVSDLDDGSYFKSQLEKDKFNDCTEDYLEDSCFLFQNKC